MSRSRTVVVGVVVAVSLASAAGAHDVHSHEHDEDATEASEAPAGGADDDERIGELEQTMQVVIEELDALRKIFAVPEESGLESYSGLGPAASKVYQRDRGLSIGGYGEVRFRGANHGKNDTFDALRLVLYTGYKFNDWLVFNSEVEFEHAGSGGGGSVSTEFLTLDFLFYDCFNARAGLLLLPMGFVNEIHEPVFFFGNERPEVERRIIPSTWRENGAGIYGSLFEDRVEYRVYGVNGFDASGFGPDGLRSGRQKGSEALAEHLAVVGRVDVGLTPGVLFGGSIYHGKSGQNQTVAGGRVPDATTTIWEVHAELARWGGHVRGLYSQSLVADTVALSTVLGKTIARRMNGGYVEFAYDVLPLFHPETEMSLEPFYRYERLDTQRAVRSAVGPPVRGADKRFHIVGLQYKPHPQVALKIDYRNIDSDGGEPDEIQVGFGFVF